MPDMHIPGETPRGDARQSLCLNGLWDFKSDRDDEWTRIRVPGCYTGALETWGAERWDVFGHPAHWLDHGAVYKRTLSIPETMNGRQVRFHCGGCFHHTTLLVNGKEAGRWDDGYMPFAFRIDPLLRSGENKIELIVSARESDFFDDYRKFSRGIWQDTWLRGYGDVVMEEDVFVTTSVAESKIRYEIPISNAGDSARRVFVRNYVRDRDGRVAKTFDGGWQDIPAGETTTVLCESDWSDPEYWFPHAPALYHLATALYDEEGRLLDTKTIRFGFREVTWDGPHLYLNGRELFLRGHGGHYLGDIQGTREYMQAWLGGLQANGLNFMRLHDNPKHACLYEVADELGMMLEGEPVFHFRVPEVTEVWQGHLARLVRRYRNHPSIILWSVSNELGWTGGGEKKELIDFAKALDPTRPVFASDFSHESKQGDVLGHHYNPKTAFSEWEEFGPDKPMIWDELGWVWPHERPLSNGTAGLECSSQDYATGLWYDGHDQILTDLDWIRDGRVFGGELHRVNAFVPWDISYVFFRWQPTNRNRTQVLPECDLEGPGLKPARIPSFASTVNAWDPSLPVFEPNPGLYLFKKHMQPVRFFDTDEFSTFVSGETVSKTARLFYDDLRLVDALVSRVESVDGAVLSESRIPLDVKPGQVLDEVTVEFAMPEVESATEVLLVRQFSHDDEPGSRVELRATVFPASVRVGDALAGKRIGVYDPDGLLDSVVRALPEHTARVKDPGTLDGSGIDILVVAAPFAEGGELESFAANGGRIVELALPEVRDTERPLVERFIETFEAENATLFDGEAHPSPSEATGASWYAWAPKGEITMARAAVMGGNEDGRVYFHFMPEPGAYLYSVLPSELHDMRHGRFSLAFDNHLEGVPWQEFPQQPPEVFERRLGLLIRDLAGRWYRSRSDRAVTLLGNRGRAEIEIDSLEWDPLEDDGGGHLAGPLRIAPGDSGPDLSSVSGVGIVEDHVPGSKVTIWYTRMEWSGHCLPSARIPLNGPKHRLLDGLAQRELTTWRGGSTAAVLPVPPGGVNTRTILLGNKDGEGAALSETFVGQGIRLRCSLNVVRDIGLEPAAAWCLRNLLAYAAGYRPGPMTRTGIVARPDLETYLHDLGVVAQTIDPGDPASARDMDVLIVDGREGYEESFRDVLGELLEGGRKVFVLGVTPQTVGFYGALLGVDLALTDPFLGETRHCVKAATSWTLADSPTDPVEYYDGVLLPQPFEPNYDPLISGIANRDLDWDGAEMFGQGIEITGMNPVDVDPSCRILVSNWRIDWSQTHFGGEYAQAGRDLRRARWFLNRDPVIFKVEKGAGSVVFCQLDLSAGGEKGARVVSHLLTGLGCSLGTETASAAPDDTFDMRAAEEQKERLARVREVSEPVQREYSGSPAELLAEMQVATSSPEGKPKVLLLGNELAIAFNRYATEGLAEKFACTLVREPVGTSGEAAERIAAQLETGTYDVIQLSLGLEDLKLGEDGRPTVDVEAYAKNLEEIFELLDATGAKLYATPILPLPAGAGDYAAGEEDRYNAAVRPVMKRFNVYVNDLNAFVRESFPDYLDEDKLEFTDQQFYRLGERVASAITYFGAQ